MAMRSKPGETFGEAVKRLGVKFVLFSWTDLFGVMRSKMVPASAAAQV
jgi:glutamine synthetase